MNVKQLFGWWHLYYNPSSILADKVEPPSCNIRDSDVIKPRKASFRRTKDTHHELFMPQKLCLPQLKRDVCMYVFPFTTAEHAFWQKLWITSSRSIKFVRGLSDAPTTQRKVSNPTHLTQLGMILSFRFPRNADALTPTNREAFALGRRFRPTDRKLIVLLRN